MVYNYNDYVALKHVLTLIDELADSFGFDHPDMVQLQNATKRLLRLMALDACNHEDLELLSMGKNDDSNC